MTAERKARHNEAAEAELAAALEVVGRQLGIALQTSAGSVEEAAHAARLPMRRVALRGPWWQRDGGPLLAWLAEDGTERPVALLPSRGGHDLFDPRSGRRPLDAATRGRLTGTAVTFYPTFPERKLSFVDLAWFAYRPHLGRLRLILVLAVVAALLGTAIPLAMRWLIDEVIPDADHRRLGELALVLVAAACGQAVFSLAQGIAVLGAQAGATMTVQAAVLDRLLRLPANFFRRFASGDLLNRAMMVTQVSQALNGASVRLLLGGSLALLSLALMVFCDFRLAMLGVAVALAYSLLSGGLAYLVRRRALDLERVRGALFGLVVQLVNGVGKLRVAQAEDRAEDHWAGHFAGQLRLTGEVRALEDVQRLVAFVLPGLSCLALYGLAAGRLTAAQDGLTLGVFLSLASAFAMFVAGLSSVMAALVDGADALARQRLMQPILEAQTECSGTRVVPGPLAGAVALERVVFRYHPGGSAVLDDVSLSAGPGEFIALVGPSGSGKSTLLRLLLGLERPESGTVRYDDRDLAGLDLPALRRQLGVVLQSAHLLSGTVFDNVAAGHAVGQEEVWQALGDACLADDVKAMPMGLHTFIAEGGANLSGGQRQRLLIARALLLSPRVLLFDEATSALDNVTQARVAEGLRRRQVTRIVVAHRLSTIQGADRIHVLDKGRIVQTGTFAELLAQEGLFARMMARQGNSDRARR